MVNGYRYLSTVLNNYLEDSLGTRNHEKLREEQRLRCVSVNVYMCVCAHNVNSARETEAQSISH